MQVQIVDDLHWVKLMSMNEKFVNVSIKVGEANLRKFGYYLANSIVDALMENFI